MVTQITSDTMISMFNPSTTVFIHGERRFDVIFVPTMTNVTKDCG